ncbi:MAG: YeeE/YedE family protein [Labilithrix sp.]|nr:YeeE/YedE family protein [Labilithrix sp.]MCW5833755.1 YeeE/YedE family protein [Labilithrix sp.]
MTPPTIAPALAGGALIGVSASLLLMLTGRVAGVSGVVGGLLTTSADGRPEAERRGETAWRLAFVLGLLAGGVALFQYRPESFGSLEGSPVSPLLVALAGVLVGVGTTLGNGCTSGHGVCGLSRLSRRSVAATAVFMAVGMLVTFVVRHVAGAR